MKFTLSRLLLIVFFIAVALVVCNLLGLPDFSMITSVVNEIIGREAEYPPATIAGSITFLICVTPVFYVAACALHGLWMLILLLWNWTACKKEEK